MAHKILVFAEVRLGKLKATAKELLTAAQSLAQAEAGSSVEAVIIGENAKDHANVCAAYGAQKVWTVDNAQTKLYGYDAYTSTLEALVKAQNYNVVLGAASPSGRDLFPRLAMRLKAGLLTEVISLKSEGGKVVGTRPMYAGKCLADVSAQSPVTLATVRPNVIAAVESNKGASAQTEAFNHTPAVDEQKFKVIELRKGKSEKPDLTEAHIIISGGRALANAENFKILFECADVVGATVGASRAAVDSGYAPHEMQVGQTGKTVNPSLYIACGISGSIQHLAGMRTSKIIVAVNTDPNAPIFQKADYGIVGDLFKAVPAMTAEFKKLLEH